MHKIFFIFLFAFLAYEATVSAAPQPGFLGIDWDKVDVGCTFSCANYYQCNVRNPGGCPYPSDCKCDTFAKK